MVKKRFLKFGFMLLIFSLAFGFVACSDDEPEATSEEIYQSLVERLYNSNGTPSFQTIEDVYYYYTVVNESEAKEYCESLIGRKLNGDDYLYNLPGNYGSIRFTKSQNEGLFYYVSVKLTDKTPFTINILHPEMLNDENGKVIVPILRND